MSDCVCTATYQCLACERAARKQRAVIKREKKPTPRPVAICGTRSGYKRHRHNGEVACTECKAAQAKAVRQWQIDHPLRHNLIRERLKRKAS